MGLEDIVKIEITPTLKHPESKKQAEIEEEIRHRWRMEFGTEPPEDIVLAFAGSIAVLWQQSLDVYMALSPPEPLPFESCVEEFVVFDRCVTPEENANIFEQWESTGEFDPTRLSGLTHWERGGVDMLKCRCPMTVGGIAHVESCRDRPSRRSK